MNASSSHIGRVLDIEIHVYRVFNEGLIKPRRNADGCGRCGRVLREEDRRVTHSGFAMATRGERTWCEKCAQVICTDTNLMASMLVNLDLTVGMELALAKMVTNSELMTNCVFPSGCECHLWNGDTNDRGYGLIVIAGVELYVHRVSLLTSGKALLPDNEVRHVCDKFDNNVDRPNKLCINPSHLWTGTKFQNSLDFMHTQGWI